MNCCEKPFEIILRSCSSSWVFNTGLTPETLYYLRVKDKFGNSYIYSATTNVSGILTIELSDSDKVNYNPFAGTFTFELSITQSPFTPIELYLCDSLFNKIAVKFNDSGEFDNTVECESVDPPQPSGTPNDGDIAVWSSELKKWVYQAPCDVVSECPGGGGAVDSVNGQSGVVVLDADNIAETGSRFWLTNVLKAAYDSAVTWIANIGAPHVANTSNPHQTDLEQARSQDNFFMGEVDMNGNRLRNLPIPVNADEAVSKSYVDGLVDNTLKAAEAFTPVGSYPTTYNGHAIQKGDSFRLSAGTIGAIVIDGEELLIAQVDTPGQTPSNWQILESNREQATESVKGIAKIVSQVDVQNELTSNNTDIVTAQKFWFGILRFVALAWTWTAKQTFTSAPRFSSVTAGKVLAVDGNKDLTTKDVDATPILSSTNLVESGGVRAAINAAVGLVARSSTNYGHTGSTGEVKVYSVLIAANTFVVGDIIRFPIRFIKVGIANTWRVGVYINPSDNLTGAKIWRQGSALVSGVRYAAATKVGVIKSSTVTEFYAGTGFSDEDVFTSSEENYNIDWTVNQYLVFFVDLVSGSTDTINLSSFYIEKK